MLYVEQLEAAVIRLTAEWSLTLIAIAAIAIVPGCGTEDGDPASGEAKHSESNNTVRSGESRTDVAVSSGASSAEASFDPDDLRMRSVVDGKESRLLQKAVVAAYPALLHNTWPPDSEKGELIEPWSIFFRLRENNGSPSASADGTDYWRVGDSEGRPFGWIKADQLVDWNSRFILAPVSPINEETRFSGRTADGDRFSHQDAQGRQTWCLLKKPPEDSRDSNSNYEFWFWAGPLETAGKRGTLAEDYKNLQSIKLEVAVLVETAANYMELEYGDYTPLRVAQSAIERLAAELDAKAELQGEVRVAVLEFSDDNHRPPYRVVQDFTGDLNAIRNAAGRISIASLKDPDDLDDLYVDGLTAIDRAVGGLDWSEFSIKHIVVVGAGPMAENSTPAQAMPLRRAKTELERLFDPRGWNGTSIYSWTTNTSGKSLRSLKDACYPQFGDKGETLLARKQLHSLVVPCDQQLWLRKRLEKLKEDDPDIDVEKLLTVFGEIQKILDADGLSSDEWTNLGDTLQLVCVMCYTMSMLDTGSDKAITQYESLADPGAGNPPGYYRRAEPSAAGLRRADEQLAQLIANGVEAVREAKRGQVENVAGTGSDTQAMRRAAFQVTDALGNKKKLDRAVTGIAPPRNANGYAWAEERVLVSRTELQELTSTVQAVYEQFRAKTRKSDRQDVGKIIEELARIMAKTASGQKIPADVPLKELITDLPLKTEALNTTAQQIAVMTSDDFRAWLDGLQQAIERCRFILEQGDDKWFALSAKSAADQVVVVKLSELP